MGAVNGTEGLAQQGAGGWGQGREGSWGDPAERGHQEEHLIGQEVCDSCWSREGSEGNSPASSPPAFLTPPGPLRIASTTWSSDGPRAHASAHRCCHDKEESEMYILLKPPSKEEEQKLRGLGLRSR